MKLSLAEFRELTILRNPRVNPFEKWRSTLPFIFRGNLTEKSHLSRARHTCSLMMWSRLPKAALCVSLGHFPGCCFIEERRSRVLFFLGYNVGLALDVPIYTGTSYSDFKSVYQKKKKPSNTMRYFSTAKVCENSAHQCLIPSEQSILVE